MNKKEIQEQRVKKYFIDSTVNLLKTEGLRSVNVRSVADNAGYSFASLYNYFKDLNELIFESVKVFVEECNDFISERVENSIQGKERIRDISVLYVKYFLEYPGAYELFFLERMGNIGNKEQICDLIYNSLNDLCKDDFAYCVKKKVFSAEQAEVLKKQLNYCVAGMLLFYHNRHNPKDYKEFITTVTEQINQVLQ
ncbi:TetR/AcrR family transcriptional regulator [Odoribacter sp. OttesenSCG-928-L07]|nr:TetR/AcrR family transcriptional regulator [Odoribacter sp. OttesenSCG-928-L07]MDL2239653.1 TetR/AcrR family transcriptional regulator [Bacteroidales bacterium OttesenSCG-928-L14]